MSPWTYNILVWIATSDTEIYIWDNNISGQYSTTATTWSVTLWNAEWYITIQINGLTKKIPYYWV